MQSQTEAGKIGELYQFYILHGAGGQHYVISYATHTPITEPGFGSLHAAVEWLERNRPGSGDYDMVELADPQEVPSPFLQKSSRYCKIHLDFCRRSAIIKM